ncbi:MAG: hypothetical protein LBK94_11440 [Prevotellaceae bacterium]|jgi:hypothetical protein|nr:hypothetical protein [Prevotellaceae bacterium]
MKKIRNIIIGLVCGMGLCITNIDTKAVNICDAPISYEDVCPAWNLSTSCGTRRTYHACSLSLALTLADMYDLIDCG